MSTINIPGVGPLTSSALTEEQIAEIFQNLILQMLGIVTDPTDPAFDEDCYARIRTEYPEEGAPTWLITEDVGFVTAFLEKDPYAEIRDQGANANDEVSYINQSVYTRVWKIEITLYGPHSGDHIRQIVSCMYLQFVYDTLAGSNLYPQTDFPEPERIPERWAKQYWKRWEFSFRLNEQVTETITLPTIASVELIIEDASGITYDQVLTPPAD